MLSPEEQMKIISEASSQGYKGNFTDLLIQAEQQDTKKVEVKETKDGLGVNDAQYQKLLAMMEQMMGVKYQVTPDYKKAEPEKSEGAGSVDESSKTEDEFDPEEMMRDEVIGKEGNTE